MPIFFQFTADNILVYLLLFMFSREWQNSVTQCCWRSIEKFVRLYHKQGDLCKFYDGPFTLAKNKNSKNMYIKIFEKECGCQLWPKKYFTFPVLVPECQVLWDNFITVKNKSKEYTWNTVCSIHIWHT